MKINEVRKAAEGYCDNEWKMETDLQVRQCIDKLTIPAFIEGAKWRINALWHDSSEKPIPGKLLLVNTIYGEYDLCYYGAYSLWNTVMTWAYMKDLIPNKED